MNTPTKLFLEKQYVIDGLVLTGEKLKQSIIDSQILKNYLKDKGWD